MAFRVVQQSLWTDEKVMDEYSCEDKYFWLYLLTNPQTNQLGIYKLPLKIAAFQLGYSREQVIVLLDRFQNVLKQIKYNKETQEVAIGNYLAYSVVKGGKPVFNCIEKDIRDIKDQSLIDFVLMKLSDKQIENKTVLEAIELLKEKRTKKENIYNGNDNDNDNGDSYHDSYHDSSNETYEHIEDNIKDNKELPNAHKEKKKKASGKISSEQVSSIIAEYVDDKETEDLVYEWLSNRNLKRAVLTERALRLNLSKMKDMADKSNLSLKDYMNEIIMRGWQAFYVIEPKASSKPKFMPLDSGYDADDEPIWNAHNNISAKEFAYRFENGAATFVRGIDLSGAFRRIMEVYPKQDNISYAAMDFFDFVKESPKSKIIDLTIRLDTYLRVQSECEEPYKYCVKMSRFIKEKQYEKHPHYDCDVYVEKVKKHYETQEDYANAIISGELEMHKLPRSMITL